MSMGRNSFLFSLVLKRAYSFYRKIGTKNLCILNIESTEIDANHGLAKIFYRADYEKKNGEKISIDFNVSYLLEFHGDDIKIFGFVAGDEMKAYKDAGIV